MPRTMHMTTAHFLRASSTLGLFALCLGATRCSAEPAVKCTVTVPPFSTAEEVSCVVTDGVNGSAVVAAGASELFVGKFRSQLPP